MLSGERVLTAAHDGTVKMWDVRTDACVATVGRCSSAVLCMEYDDSTGILAAGGRDAYVYRTSKVYFVGLGTFEIYSSFGLNRRNWCQPVFLVWQTFGIFAPEDRCTSSWGTQNG